MCFYTHLIIFVHVMTYLDSKHDILRLIDFYYFLISFEFFWIGFFTYFWCFSFTINMWFFFVDNKPLILFSVPTSTDAGCLRDHKLFLCVLRNNMIYTSVSHYLNLFSVPLLIYSLKFAWHSPWKVLQIYRLLKENPKFNCKILLYLNNSNICVWHINPYCFDLLGSNIWCFGCF